MLANPKARLALVGDGPHRADLAQHFAGLPVHMAGFLHGEELAQAYASSDIFIMPSRSETLGLVILEAMSSGLPVVPRAPAAFRRWSRTASTAFFLTRRPEAIAAIEKLLPRPSLRETVGHAARARAEHFGWRAATLLLLEHYRAACAQQHIAPKSEPDGAHRNLDPAPKAGCAKRPCFPSASCCRSVLILKFASQTRCHPERKGPQTYFPGVPANRSSFAGWSLGVVSRRISGSGALSVP